LSLAVTPGNRGGLRGAARHIGPVRRRDDRRISMGPIPGNIIGRCVTDIACRRLRYICQGFAVRCPVGVVVCSRPEGPDIISAVMPERSGDWPMGNRMRRGKPAAKRRARACECLVRGKHKR
jgi:hypothetical protein